MTGLIHYLLGLMTGLCIGLGYASLRLALQPLKEAKARQALYEARQAELDSMSTLLDKLNGKT